jgi:hypothetical protein
MNSTFVHVILLVCYYTKYTTVGQIPTTIFTRTKKLCFNSLAEEVQHGER